MNEAEKLEPCRFCDDDQFVYFDPRTTQTYCDSCGARGPISRGADIEHSRRLSAERWNLWGMRRSDAEMKDLRERLGKAEAVIAEQSNTIQQQATERDAALARLALAVEAMKKSSDFIGSLRAGAKIRLRENGDQPYLRWMVDLSKDADSALTAYFAAAQSPKDCQDCTGPGHPVCYEHPAPKPAPSLAGKEADTHTHGRYVQVKGGGFYCAECDGYLGRTTPTPPPAAESKECDLCEDGKVYDGEAWEQDKPCPSCQPVPDKEGNRG